jgi:uncharacterized protein with NRDE domain
MKYAMSRIEFEVETLQEDYEWLVSFREIDVNNGENAVSDVYVVSICAFDINWEKNSVGYIHIENIDYLCSISEGGDEEIIERCHEIFRVIEREVVEEIISL